MTFKKFARAFAISAIALPAFAITSHADKAQMDALVPDVAYQRKTDRTHLFSRTQLIYSLGTDSYLHRWIDRPLLVDPSLDANKPPSPLMTLRAYEEMQKAALNYGLDGFSFFPQTSRRSPFYEYVKQSDVAGFQLLSEFVVNDQDTTKANALKMALDTPQSFRIGNKLVITSYRADSKPVEFWQKEIAALKAQFGDTFLFLPDVSNFAGQSSNIWKTKYHQNKITPADIENSKEYLRQWARATDGLYCAYAAGMIDDQRTFDADFYQNFIVRLMKSVLAEPEFHQKYFGLSAVQGHENNTRFGYTLSSDATKTMRHSLDVAIGANPDIINLPEWDEQNENTSWRPTVYNGFSTMRIMRYYTAQTQGKKPAPLPDDDVTIPDLIISYRKLLTLGEKVEIELLNVPDAASQTPFAVHLTLQDADGNTVYDAPLQNFNGQKLEAHTINVPSEALAKYAVLRPKIEITANSHKSTFMAGLHYIEIRPTWNWDYKWVKQPLRDLLKPAKENFAISAPNTAGIRTATADFVANEPLRYVEVLDDDDVIYSYSAADNWRENADQIIIKLEWSAFGGMSAGLKMKGDVTLKNAAARWLVEDNSNAPTLQKQTLNFDKKIASQWGGRVLVAMPRTDIDNAVFAVNLPGIFQGDVPVKVLLARAIYGIPGPKGFNLVLSHYVSQDKMPLNINENAVNFTVPVQPDSSNAVLHLQAIAKSGRIYRSRPLLLDNVKTVSEKIAVYSDTTGYAENVEVNKNRVPDIRYEFDPSRGSVLVTDAGRSFWGVAGGYFAMATGRGGGNAGDDTPFIQMRGLPKDYSKTAPDWVKTEDGQNALQFDGKSTFVALPQGAIPRRAGWTIEMDINPDSENGKQVIIANRSYYPGSFTFFTDKGILKADFLGENYSKSALNSGLKLPPGKWSHLTISYDQKTLTFRVDDKTSAALSVPGPGIYETASVVGGYDEEWFAGRIKSLRIRHGV